MSVTVFFNFQAAPGNAGELLALLRQGRDFGLTVPGCEAYEIQQGKDDQHRFMMVERWASPAEHQEHFEKNVLASGVLDRATALMVQPPEPPVYYELR